MHKRLQEDIERQKRVMLEEVLKEIQNAFIVLEVTEETLPPWVAVLSDRIDAVLKTVNDLP